MLVPYILVQAVQRGKHMWSAAAGSMGGPSAMAQIDEATTIMVVAMKSEVHECRISAGKPVSHHGSHTPQVVMFVKLLPTGACMSSCEGHACPLCLHDVPRTQAVRRANETCW